MCYNPIFMYQEISNHDIEYAGLMGPYLPLQQGRVSGVRVDFGLALSNAFFIY